jgi:hypothetical protein
MDLMLFSSTQSSVIDPLCNPEKARKDSWARSWAGFSNQLVRVCSKKKGFTLSNNNVACRKSNLSIHEYAYRKAIIDPFISCCKRRTLTCQ